MRQAVAPTLWPTRIADLGERAEQKSKRHDGGLLQGLQGARRSNGSLTRQGRRSPLKPRTPTRMGELHGPGQSAERVILHLHIQGWQFTDINIETIHRRGFRAKKPTCAITRLFFRRRKHYVPKA